MCAAFHLQTFECFFILKHIVMIAKWIDIECEPNISLEITDVANTDFINLMIVNDRDTTLIDLSVNDIKEIISYLQKCIDEKL